MTWNQLFVEIPESLKDAAIGELDDFGAAGVWESGVPGPGLVELTIYFDAPPDADAIRDQLKALYSRAGLEGEPRIQGAEVEDRDWGEEWKRSWTSFAMGKRFFIIPSWSTTECPDDRLPLFIDPGQAFGTGTHETTQLTLEALERWFDPERVVMDLGTGSGILAMAAVLLGASRVTGIDVDPLAVEVAAENVERNVPGRVALLCASADAVETASVGLLLANITADTITSLFPDIDRMLQPGGLAIFSGILTIQADAIRTLLQNAGFTVLEEESRGEWCAFTARKDGR